MLTIIVTGASRGLGAHICKRAHESGYRVIGLARNPGESTERPWEVRSCDVSVPEEIEAALSSERKNSELYGLVHAAGIASMNLALTTPKATMRKIVETNLLGTMYTNTLVGKWLVSKKRGRIVNFSTIAVPLGIKGEAVYAASKAGVETFSRVFAREMASFGVTVNVIAPGPIATDLIAGVSPEKIAEIVSRQVIPKQATPEDVWRLTAHLLGEEATMLSGQVFHLGGV